MADNSELITKMQRLAQALVGRAEGPSEAMKEDYGLDPDLDIVDYPMQVCLAFDAIVIRCDECDWWIERDEFDRNDGCCDDCARSR